MHEGFMGKIKNKIKLLFKLFLFLFIVVVYAVGLGILGVMGLVVWQEAKSWGILAPLKWALFGGLGVSVVGFTVYMREAWVEFWRR